MVPFHIKAGFTDYKNESIFYVIVVLFLGQPSETVRTKNKIALSTRQINFKYVAYVKTTYG